MNRDLRNRLKQDQHFLRFRRKVLLSERSRLGRFKGKQRTSEERKRRTKIENEVLELERRIQANAKLLPPVRRKLFGLAPKENDRGIGKVAPLAD